MGHPLHPVCRPANETVFVVDRDADRRADIVGKVTDLGYEALAFETSREFYAAADNRATGVALLNVGPGEDDGVSVHEWILEQGLSLSVIYIHHGTSVETAVHCLKLGAVDLLQWPIGEMTLRNALRSAVSANRPSHCVKQSRSVAASLVATLTPTEMHVAGLIAKGHPTKSVAHLMERSENTVKIHRHRIFTKLKVRSAASIANILLMLDDLPEATP